MATILQNLAKIRTAIYGKDVRESIADSIEQMNTVANNAATHADNALHFVGNLSSSDDFNNFKTRGMWGLGGAGAQQLNAPEEAPLGWGLLVVNPAAGGVVFQQLYKWNNGNILLYERRLNVDGVSWSAWKTRVERFELDNANTAITTNRNKEIDFTRYVAQNLFALRNTRSMALATSGEGWYQFFFVPGKTYTIWNETPSGAVNVHLYDDYKGTKLVEYNAIAAGAKRDITCTQNAYWVHLYCNADNCRIYINDKEDVLLDMILAKANIALTHAKEYTDEVAFTYKGAINSTATDLNSLKDNGWWSVLTQGSKPLNGPTDYPSGMYWAGMLQSYKNVHTDSAYSVTQIITAYDNGNIHQWERRYWSPTNLWSPWMRQLTRKDLDSIQNKLDALENRLARLEPLLTLESISATSSRNYIRQNESFPRDYVTVVATYNTGDTKEVTNYTVPFSGDMGTKRVFTISYTENHVTKSCNIEFPIVENGYIEG